MENEARSMDRTSSRSSGRIRSIERSDTTLQLGLGRPQIDGYEVGGRDGLSGGKPSQPQDTDGGRRRHAAMWRRQPPVRRGDEAGGGADENHRLGDAGGQRLGRDGEIV